MRCALYVRVRTNEQAKSGYSIPDQLQELRRHATDEKGRGCYTPRPFSCSRLRGATRLVVAGGLPR